MEGMPRCKTTMASTEGSRCLVFVAVGRVRDCVRLAYYVEEDVLDRVAALEMFTNVLSQGWRDDQQRSFDWNGGGLCCRLDSAGEILYCVAVRTLTFPDYKAYQMLAELEQSVLAQELPTAGAEADGLCAELEQQARPLLAYYEEIGRQAEGVGCLPFMAIGRIKDGVRLAYHIEQCMACRQQGLLQEFAKLLAKPRPVERLRRDWDHGSFLCLLDIEAGLLYCVFASTTVFPEGLAEQILAELRQDSNGLNTRAVGEDGLKATLELKMKNLLAHYSETARVASLGASMRELKERASAELGFRRWADDEELEEPKEPAPTPATPAIPATLVTLATPTTPATLAPTLAQQRDAVPPLAEPLLQHTSTREATEGAGEAGGAGGAGGAGEEISRDPCAPCRCRNCSIQ